MGHLPDNATSEILQYQIDFRQAVQPGLDDSHAGRVVPLVDAKRQFGFEYLQDDTYKTQIERGLSDIRG